MWGIGDADAVAPGRASAEMLLASKRRAGRDPPCRKHVMRTAISLLVALVALALAAPAGAQIAPVFGGGPAPQPYGTNDYGGFRDVLPPGTNGFDNAVQLGQFELTHARPPHNDDQLGMYSNLVYAAPNLAAADIGRYYKDSTFGVPAGASASSESPRSDVTIVRDKGFGVPHIYGSTRSGLMFGIGYATAEDRLFFIDVLRHLGRSELSSFAGGAAGNRAFDESEWQIAPYTEADFQAQYDRLPQEYGALGSQVQQDASDYVAGINAYILHAKLNPALMPGEYAAIGRPQGPDAFNVTDLFATASLVGGIFGKGGGNELPWTQFYETLRQRLGNAAMRSFLDFRDPDDPEAPTTIHTGQRFPYRTIPRRDTAGSVALPDAGSVANANVVTAGQSSTSASPSAAARSRALIALPHTDSNALLVSARKSADGHPLAVFGPQVAYFAPEILMEEDIHGPGVDARGAAFPGVNLYVELGHGRDYAWSATSAGQDIVDTFAVPLCNPSGGAASKDSTYYVFRGQCLQMEALQRVNNWTPNAADQTPPGSETLTTYRTKLGLVVARAAVGGRPVAYTQLRSTYMHEVDSAAGFLELNDPNAIRTPQDFQRAASLIQYTFNWFYADNRHVAYFNSGANPVRAPGTNPLFPVWSSFEWAGFNPDRNTAAYTPASEHPQVVDQDYLTSWNNKQAPGYAFPDNDAVFSPIYRSQLLDDRIRGALRAHGTLHLVDLINAMEDAATVDLRGDKVLPWVLRTLAARPRATLRTRHRGRHQRFRTEPSAPPPPALASDPAIRGALAELRAWVADGAHRRDPGRTGTYQHSYAIRIMDAWYPLLVKAIFEPTLGSAAFAQLEQVDQIDNPPNNDGQHLGSSWDVGFYGTIQKDLRTLLRQRVRGRPSRVYCGGGNLARCQTALLASLKQALAVDPAQLYKDDTCKAAGMQGNQECFDDVYFRPLGAVTQPLIPWVNRPTYQQAVDIQGHR
jgi:acyl-homoserine lactone acylase PvdQ